MVSTLIFILLNENYIKSNAVSALARIFIRVFYIFQHHLWAKYSIASLIKFDNPTVLVRY